MSRMEHKERQGWREVKLGDVATVFGGFAFKGKDFGNKGEPVIKITELQPPYINLQNCQKINLQPYFSKNLDKYKIKKGEYLVAMTGATIGKVGRLTENKVAYLNQRVAKVEALTKYSDTKFIYYSIVNSYFINFVKNSATGGVQQNISADEIGKFQLLLPPLPEQKAIAEVLSSLDDKIDLLHRQNKTLEDMAQALFRKWFVEDADEGWKIEKLDNILEEIESGTRPKGGIDINLKEGIPSIGAESINGIGNFDFSKTKYISSEYFLNMKRGKIKEYDVLIYKDGAYIGKKALYGNGFPFEQCAVNEHVFILRTNKRATQIFLYFLLEQKALFELNANSAQPGLNKQSIKSFEVQIPPQNKIDNFDIKTKPLIEKILKNCTQIYILENFRNTLLPKLISGDVRMNKL